MLFSSIQTKIVAGIISVLVVGLSLATFFTVRTQRDNLLEARRQDVANNSSTLNISVRNVMLAGEAPVAVSLLEDLSTAPGFRTLEVYRRDGTLAFSDDTTLEEVNANLGGNAFPPSPRRSGEALSGPAFDQVVTFNTPHVVEDLGSETLQYYFPILNYQECRACHGSDHFVRGVAYYEVSLASVFDRITSARNSLGIMFLVVGAIVSTALVSLMQRTVVSPIRRIGDVVTRVGAGDLEVAAEVGGSREFIHLSDLLNRMISGLKDRNRLEIENSVIDARDQENRKYLDNITEGLVLIDRDLEISEQYSRYVETLFGTSEIAGRRFSAFVYADVPEDADERRELDQFVRMIFENTATEMEMILTINPIAEKTIQVRDGTTESGYREVVFGTTFQRVFADDGTVERVMAIFEDRTDVTHAQKELQAERERYKNDIEHIATLLKTGPEAYTEFERTAGALLDTLESSFETGLDPSTQNALMRELHTLKGTARYMEFFRVGDLAHKAEDQIGAGDRSGLEQTVGEMRNELESLSSINQTFREFAARVAPGDKSREELKNLTEHLTTMTARIADELGKAVQLAVDARVSEIPRLSRVRDALIHLIRNAIDHGIEDQYERLSAGKEGTGTITVTLDEDSSSTLIVVADDGAGIDFRAVADRAIEKGLLKRGDDATEKQLLQTLFSPSFSTRAAVTNISGCGVGLDAVYNTIREMGGRISVGTRAGNGTRFTLTIPKEVDS